MKILHSGHLFKTILNLFYLTKKSIWTIVIVFFASPILSNSTDTYSTNYHGLYYGLWSVIVGLGFASIFYIIWLKKKDDGLSDEKISGIKWFSRAILTWAISGLWIVFSSFFEELTKADVFVRSVLSSVNSMFILFAIPSIEVNSKWIKQNIYRRLEDKPIIAFLFGLITLSTVIFFYFAKNYKSDSYDLEYLSYSPDVFASSLTILILGIVLSTAFDERNMRIMKKVVYVTLVITFIAQLVLIAPTLKTISENNEIYWVAQNLSATVFKIFLIALILILLYTWEVKNAKEKLSELTSTHEKSIQQKDKIVQKLQSDLKDLKDKFPEIAKSDKEKFHDNEPITLMFGKDSKSNYRVFTKKNSGFNFDFNKNKSLFKSLLKLAVLTKKNEFVDILDASVTERKNLKFTELDDQYISSIRNILKQPFKDLIKVDQRKGRVNLSPEFITFLDYDWDDQKSSSDILLELYELHEIS